MPTTEILTLTTPQEVAQARGGDASLTRVFAPPPAIDKWPIVLGSNISFAYIAATMRESLGGYRQLFVDVLDEMLDIEGHGYSVLSKRILGVAGARIELVPAKCANAIDEPRALEMCRLVESQFDNIPYRTEHIATLLWALYYGLTAAEILWARTAGAWTVEGLQFIHSRRLAYPFYGMKEVDSPWDLYIWDQGAVQGFGQSATNGIYGLRIADYPNKFLVYSPKIRGNYPTREGLGRILVTYLALKRLVLRMSAQDFERFAKPWVVAYYKVTDDATGKPRDAEKEDIKAADDAMRGIGTGSLAGVVLPDSVRIELLRAATTLDQAAFLAWLDAAISKTVVGQTFTSEPGKHGTKGTNDTGKEDQVELSHFDGAGFADMLKAQLFVPIIACNEPGNERFAPTAKIHVQRTDPQRLVDIATKLADRNAPVDGAKICETVGVPLIDPKDKDAVRLKPVAMTTPSGEAAPAPSPGALPSPTDAAPAEAERLPGEGDEPAPNPADDEEDDDAG